MGMGNLHESLAEERRLVADAFYAIACCNAYGPRFGNGEDRFGGDPPYSHLAGLAAAGRLLAYPLLMQALIDRLVHFKTNQTRMGDRNWDRGLPALLQRCPVLLPHHLAAIDAAATANGELTWMRAFVAAHPGTDANVLQRMIDRGFGDDAGLATEVRNRLAEFDKQEERRERAVRRRQRARNRLMARLGETDPAALALYRMREEQLSVEEILEIAGVGDTTGCGLVGGGSGVKLPSDSEFDPEQFDIWEIAPSNAPPVYAISWRGDDGRPIEHDGLYHDREEIRVMLARRYGRFELWTD
jgi:hypothetical protein